MDLKSLGRRIDEDRQERPAADGGDRHGNDIDRQRRSRSGHR